MVIVEENPFNCSFPYSVLPYAWQNLPYANLFLLVLSLEISLPKILRLCVYLYV